MIALFDRSCDLVGWMDVKSHDIFDAGMRWVGFWNHDGAFRSNDLVWIGPLKDGALYDQNGKCLAWSCDPIGVSPDSILPFTPTRPREPAPPIRPLDPVKPFQPRTPIGGWSQSGFGDFFVGEAAFL